MRTPGEELAHLESESLRRNLRRIESPQGPHVLLSGREVLNFSSNDYLGLADSPDLVGAFQENLSRYGVGSGASRLVCGSLAPHVELEQKLAEVKRTEAALTFSSGFATATGAIPAICQKDDVIILDKLSHASLIDGSRLSGATIRVFPHNDLDKLRKHLKWAKENIKTDSRILVITESVFSMDGDLAPLKEICDLKGEFGALLLVDEAHAFGILGPQGRGLAADLGLETRIDFHMGTFSKAMGLSGGYLCSSREWTDLWINKARSFIYSTAPSPALAATISGALDLITGEEGEALRTKLWENIHHFSAEATSAIIPLILGENDKALQVSQDLQENGFLVPAIRFPTVPRGTARLRITLSAAHSSEEIDSLKSALAQFTSTS